MRIGTRASALALAQASQVAALIGEAGGEPASIVEIRTTGDREAARPLSEIGGLGVFTRELEDALLDSRVDLAVHSLKDLPTQLPAGLVLAAVPRREDPRDALISASGAGLMSLAAGARVGTSSQRRAAQVLAARPDLVCVDIRGNVSTRIRKMESGEFDAVVLAVAGLRRLGLADRITEILNPAVMLPAVSQGALGLEAREGDAATRERVASLDHAPSFAAVRAERSLLRDLGGGCRLPIGGWARIEGGVLVLSGCACSPDGTRVLRAEASGPPDAAEQLGAKVAAELRLQGAAELLAAV